MSAKKIKTTSMRLGEEDYARLDKIRELRDRSLSNTEIVRDAIAEYAALLERRANMMKGELRSEYREIAREEVRTYMTELQLAYRQCCKRTQKGYQAKTVNEMHAVADFLEKLVRKR